MNIKQTLPFLALCLPFLAHAQGSCSNPITLSDVLVSNTQCGVATGTIILTPGGGIGLYTYNWTPSVSISNVATNVAAGTYAVHIERATEPACKLDTIILVNNSNGPQVQATINPAQCQANNGSISLSPTNLLFNWSTGSSGPSLTGLASKNYYVTVTNPNNNCYAVYKYFVPKDNNSLTVNALVQEDAKCGMNNGRAQVLVTGGSGQYNYNPGPGPQYNNLAPNNYTIQVLDNQTGCTGVANFTIQGLQVTGSVVVTPHNVKCAGQSTGFVEFEVTAGQNFDLPYVFTLKDPGGTSYSPGSLPVGNYILQVADADGCTLPAQNFSILGPPSFNAQVQSSPETCAMGGQISIAVSGGNGAPYFVNWADLPGDDNPANRINLHAGRYAAIVYDSLFCAYALDTVLIAPNCNNASIVHIVLGINKTESFCVPPIVGLAPGAVLYSGLGGITSGNTAFGSWTLNNNGCLSYTAGATPGFAVDTICIVATANQIGLKDTLCVVISITQQQPSKQSVFFTTQINSSSTACGTIPPSFSSTHILQLGRPGLSGTSDTYGAYQIDNVNACTAFFANAVPGFNVDEIRVAVFDTINDKCHIISYFPTILPKNDCANAVDLGAPIHLIITDCNGAASTCIPIPFDDIINYSVIDNAALYNGGYAGCDINAVVRYNVAQLPIGGGPYVLTEWTINGQNFSGNFLNFNGLVDLMNLFDAASWSSPSSGQIRGGDLAQIYGPLKIQSATGVVAVFNPSTIQVPMGTEMHLAPGMHTVVFRNVQTACADTLFAEIKCFDCAPIHSYPLNASGTVNWNVSDCNSDTIFCTNILNAELGQYLVTDNGSTFTNYTLCGNFIGLNLDTGFHQIFIRNTATTCEWTVPIQLDCKNVLHQTDIPVNVLLGNTVTVCLDSSFVNSPITSIQNICEDEGSVIIGYSLDNQHWCVQIMGQNLGSDTLCIQLCNAANECADYTILVNVTNSLADSLLAVMDEVYTLKNESLNVNIIANDLVGGLLGNLAGIQQIEFLSDPTLGTYTYNPFNGQLEYTPDPGKCGIDSFRYRITDGAGRQSTATIKVTISCDKVLVFKGISPNGDGRNDLWHIIGIEQFPNNAVQVFNRWGNLVFDQNGYTNASAWNGEWNGKVLPDGTYFYVITLGGNGGNLSGWLQIMR